LHCNFISQLLKNKNMKILFVIIAVGFLHLFSEPLFAQSSQLKLTGGNKTTNDTAAKTKSLFLDVHHFGPGKVTAKDVAAAHKKDLAVQKKYGVNLINYWLDEKSGDVYCLASAPDSQSLRAVHAEAHGLLPDNILKVT